MSANSELLHNLKQALDKGEISQKDILQILNQDHTTDPKTRTHSQHTPTGWIQTVLSYTGGLLVALGVVFLVSLNWVELGDVGQVIAVFGGGIVAYILGLILLKSFKEPSVGMALEIIAAILLPAGSLLWISKLDLPANDPGLIAAVIFGSVASLYGLTRKFVPQSVFTLMAAMLAGVSYFSLIQYIHNFQLNDNPYLRISNFAPLILGIAYLALARYNPKEHRVAGWFNGLGSALALGACFDYLTQTQNDTLLVITYPILLSLWFYLGSRLRSTTILIWSYVFLVIYIIYVTTEVFANLIGWPLGLILGGTLLIGGGYLGSNYYKRQTIQKNPTTPKSDQNTPTT